MSWIGVDLDGTLAKYGEWNGIEDIGLPIPLMVDRVKKWVEEGKDVRIFTARVCPVGHGLSEIEDSVTMISTWCAKHIGKVLPITCMKDYSMIELWDDRCIQVEHNTGRIVLNHGEEERFPKPDDDSFAYSSGM